MSAAFAGGSGYRRRAARGESPSSPSHHPSPTSPKPAKRQARLCCPLPVRPGEEGGPLSAEEPTAAAPLSKDGGRPWTLAFAALSTAHPGADVPPPLPGGERIAEHDRLRSMRSLVRGDGRVTMESPTTTGGRASSDTRQSPPSASVPSTRLQEVSTMSPNTCPSSIRSVQRTGVRPSRLRFAKHLRMRYGVWLPQRRQGTDAPMAVTTLLILRCSPQCGEPRRTP
jgi:hypothetical protein